MTDVEGFLTEEEAAEQQYQQWVAMYLHHVRQLPNVVQATVTVVVGPRQLKAAQLRERVSGGGYIDNVPVVDGPEARNARAVWDALRAYLRAVSSRVGVEAPLLPPVFPDDVDTARGWAFTASEWLEGMVDPILDHPDLAEVEGVLFRLIVRASHRLGVGVVRRAPGEPCVVCGEPRVFPSWSVDGAGGLRLTRACERCGEQYGGDR